MGSDNWLDGDRKWRSISLDFGAGRIAARPECTTIPAISFVCTGHRSAALQVTLALFIGNAGNYAIALGIANRRR